MKPKENPEDKAARLRERRLSLLEQKETTEESARGLTTDLRAVYGLKNIKAMPPGAVIGKPVTGKAPSLFGKPK